MKKLALSVVAVSSLLGSSCALADNHTLSLGYAQAKVQDFKNIRGLNMHTVMSGTLRSVLSGQLLI